MDNITFKIITDGTIAKNEIEKVDKSIDKLSQTTNKNTIDMTKSWVALGAGIAGVTALVISATKKGLEYEKQTFMMTVAQEELLKAIGGTNKELVASYITTAKSVGISDEATKKLINSAKALGRIYPSESTEEFVNNLVQLNKTGEAQGYIVDILEQKYGAIDLKTISLADKMATLDEMTKGVNERFDNLASTKLDKFGVSVDNAFAELGVTFVELFNSLGWIDEATDKMSKFDKTVKISKDNMAFWAIAVMDVGGRVVDVFNVIGTSARVGLKQLELYYAKALNVFGGGGAYIDEVNAKMDYGAKSVLKSWENIRKPLGETITSKYKTYLETDKKIQVANEKAVKEMQDREIKAGKKAKELADKIAKDKAKALSDKRNLAIREALNRKITASEKALAKKILAINKKIDDDYLKSTLSAVDYEKYKLGIMYAERVKYAKNVNKLNVWFVKEVEKLDKKEIASNKQKLDMQRKETSGSNAQINEMNNNLTDSEMARHEKIADAMTDSFMNFTQSSQITFKNFALTMGTMLEGLAQDFLKVYMQQQMIGAVSGGSSMLGDLFGGGGGTSMLGMGGASSGGGQSMFGFEKGGAFDGSGVRFLAKGGVINSPMMFGSKEGLNVAGEAGAEAILPLTRTSGGDLGVKAITNANTSNQTINKATVYFTVQAMDSSSFQSSLMANQNIIENIVANSLGTNGVVRSSL